MTRATQFGRVPRYVHQADCEICLLVQIESQRGLDAIEEIAAVEGVDGIFVGPADLAADLGHIGALDHPQVLAAVEDAIRRIIGEGKPAGILTTNEKLAERFIALGCSFTAVGVDATLLARTADARALRWKPT